MSFGSSNQPKGSTQDEIQPFSLSDDEDEKRPQQAAEQKVSHQKQFPVIYNGRT